MSNAPILIESLNDNGSKRSITQGVFPPGAECYFHYHTQFEETFEVIEGKFTVFIGNTKLTLTKGQSSPQIKKREIHRFKNLSQKNVIANIILEPGHPGCENVNKILSGLEKDGKFSLLSKLKGYNILWIIVYEMTNTLLTGMPKAIFYFLRLIKGEIKIKKLENALLDKYCNRNLS
jgi:mannose-6-phosphate isomerase-like protein (cupin superfamily)